MSEACFWIVKEERMAAICVACKEQHNIDGWYWPGHEKGYGDYDLECYICSKVIHTREHKGINE